MLMLRIRFRVVSSLFLQRDWTVLGLPFIPVWGRVGERGMAIDSPSTNIEGEEIVERAC